MSQDKATDFAQDSTKLNAFQAAFSTVRQTQLEKLFSSDDQPSHTDVDRQDIENIAIIDKYAKLEGYIQWQKRRQPLSLMQRLTLELRALEEQSKHPNHTPLHSMNQETQDLILTLADRIRSIRLTEQTEAQPFTTKSLERVTPPLPTAAHISETWVNRSDASREAGETPLDFFKRVYAPWVGVITKADVRRIDPKLYRAFYNFKTVPSDDALPNSVGRWDGQVVTERDKEIYSKVIALQARKRRATK